MVDGVNVVLRFVASRRFGQRCKVREMLGTYGVEAVPPAAGEDGVIRLVSTRVPPKMTVGAYSDGIATCVDVKQRESKRSGRMNRDGQRMG
jgi:hypothetical protein